jgi:hypothetical protein
MLFIGLGILHNQGFFTDFLYISSILQGGNYIEGETFTWIKRVAAKLRWEGDGHWVEVGAQRPFLRVIEPKKTGAQGARLLVLYN